MSQIESYADEVLNRFTYHAPEGSQTVRYTAIRDTARDFAQKLIRLCPESGELRNALDRLDEAVMWANASIARNE